MNGFYIFLVLLLNSCETYKVLVFSPAFGASHSNFLGKISDILLDAGNDVTLLIPTYMESKANLVGSKNVKNIIRIAQDPRAQEMLKYSEADDIMRKKVWNNVSDTALLLPIIKNFTQAATHQCEFIMQNFEIIEKLREKKFDLGISESAYICGLALFDKLGIKTVIAADSMSPQDAVKYAFGEPSSTSYYPGIFSQDNDELSIFGRAKSLIGFVVSFGFARYRYSSELEAINSTKTWFDYFANIAYNMLNSNSYLDYPCPVSPKSVFIGGIQVIQGAKLDKKWDDILNLRKTTILVSFGSHSFSSEMPESYKSSILEVFKSFPEVTFIWKYEIENDTIVDHLPNVILTTWMPQTDLLSDNRLKLFITHGGLGSVMEVAYLGKPALVISLYGDQHRNAHMLTRHGGALQLDKSKLGNYVEIKNAIETVLTDPSYLQNATKLARILMNQPNSPREVVLKYCNFAVEFGHLESIKSKGRLLNFVQYNSLDVIAFIIILIVIIILIIFYSLRFVYRLVRKFLTFGQKKYSKVPREKEQ